MATVFCNGHPTGALASRPAGLTPSPLTAARTCSKGRVLPISHPEDWAAAPEEFAAPASGPPTAE